MPPKETPRSTISEKRRSPERKTDSANNWDGSGFGTCSQNTLVLQSGSSGFVNVQIDVIDAPRVTVALCGAEALALSARPTVQRIDEACVKRQRILCL